MSTQGGPEVITAASLVGAGIAGTDVVSPRSAGRSSSRLIVVGSVSMSGHAGR
ncbi:hypothetical protein HCA58_13795 [Micromonospora sp. HNM0581]|uniref:hypothetical protein n=1 Tax=Micromonospora sp. HNM0581 TaxID=2716341 RepID=UPI00146D2555|nr:hypothetical protein [Micromonospora sp. HNM0581]NLU79437.1 hypothetical protein [Micromonospora sp. HNM0581]